MPGVSRWHGDEAARRAVYNNRARLRSGVAKRCSGSGPSWSSAASSSPSIVAACVAAWLRGRENLHKRYLVHVAGYNLGLIMRLLVGTGTPREFLAGASAQLVLLTTVDDALTGILIVATGTELIVATGTEAALLVVSFGPDLHG